MNQKVKDIFAESMLATLATVNEDGSIERKVAQERVFEDRMYLYPIPEAEYWKTNIENNPGWE